ncbi:MAG: class I SAM-dependent methyltransferase [Acidobacteria bacterium ACB2]|nr:class I SAM-dependent methyltransferase [Acidobacteria bacterium ACB2]
MTREDAAATGVERGLVLLGDLSGARVVDLGCGTGRLEEVLLPRLGRGSVVAVDFSPAMIGEASRRCGDPRVTWLLSDVHAAEITAGSADVVLCFDAFPHFHGRAALLAAVARWLRPDGAFLLWHDIGREALASVHRRAGPAMENDLLPPVSELATLAAAAGLTVRLAAEDDASYTLLTRRPA